MRYWEEAWQRPEERTDWLTPASYVSQHIMCPAAPGARALDLGMGVGRHALLLAREGYETIGLDVSPTGLRYGRAWAAREGLRLHLALSTMAALPLATGSLDLIVAWNVIYHGYVAEVQRAVDEIRRCLRPGGYLLCSLISTRNEHYGWGREVEAHTYVAEGGEKAYPHHYFDRGEIARFFEDYRLLDCRMAAPEGTAAYYWQVLARLAEG